MSREKASLPPAGSGKVNRTAQPAARHALRAVDPLTSGAIAEPVFEDVFFPLHDDSKFYNKLKLLT